MQRKEALLLKKILETINQIQKRRINKKLTEKRQKLTETQQKLTEAQQKLIKTLQKLKKITKITSKKYHKLTEKYHKLIGKQQKIIKSQKLQQKKQIVSQEKLIKSQQKLIKSSDGNNSLSFMEYLNLIKPYLEDLINDKKNKGEWKLQLTAQISFVSLKPGSDETRLTHTRSVTMEFMSGSKTEEIIESLYRSLLQNYYDNLQEKMRGSDFVFNGINNFYYDFNRVSISKGGSYIESPKWLKNKKSTVNQKNNDYKYFQYATILALNFDKVTSHPERISKKIKSFINKYNWNDINFPATRKDWNRFEVNNKNVALNILYVSFNTKKIEIAYKSKYNLVRDNQILLLMISNSEKWHYLAVKSLSRLLRGITSNHDGDYYCLNCFHSYRTENKLNAHKKVCENHDYCNIEMSSNDNNLINYNKGEKSLKLPFIIYADLECLLEKISTCYDNPNLSSTTKINQHVPFGYSIFTNCSL